MRGDDWLTLNVWSPDPSPDAALPVMVWIHGGAYVFGTSGLPEYDGGRLARDGGVVVVTFNYRVGIEGFAHIEGAPANRGLLDQVAALEWVRDNIRAFGGDPDRVTVFGQSAGGGSVAALLAMPRAAGLFRRAIAQSVPGTFFTPGAGRRHRRRLRRRARAAVRRPPICPRVDPTLLPAAGDAVSGEDRPQSGDRWGQAAHRSIPFAPVVDGDVLPTTPWQALADGAGTGRRPDRRAHPRRAAAVHAVDGLLGEITEEQAADRAASSSPRPTAPRYRDAFPTPARRALRAGPLGLAVPDAVAAPRRGAAAAGGRATSTS